MKTRKKLRKMVRQIKRRKKRGSSRRRSSRRHTSSRRRRSSRRRSSRRRSSRRHRSSRRRRRLTHHAHTHRSQGNTKRRAKEAVFKAKNYIRMARGEKRKIQRVQAQAHGRNVQRTVDRDKRKLVHYTQMAIRQQKRARAFVKRAARRGVEPVSAIVPEMVLNEAMTEVYLTDSDNKDSSQDQLKK